MTFRVGHLQLRLVEVGREGGGTGAVKEAASVCKRGEATPQELQAASSLPEVLYLFLSDILILFTFLTSFARLTGWISSMLCGTEL